MNKEKIIELLSSPEADAVCTIAAFAVKKTPTDFDNELVGGIDQYADIIAEKASDIHNRSSTVTNKQALKAAVLLLEKVASQAGNKWLKLAASLLKKIT